MVIYGLYIKSKQIIARLDNLFGNSDVFTFEYVNEEMQINMSKV